MLFVNYVVIDIDDMLLRDKFDDVYKYMTIQIRIKITMFFVIITMLFFTSIFFYKNI